MTCRNGDGPIPWDKAVAYAERKGFAPDMADLLWTVIRKMDAADRDWQVSNLKDGGGDG